jgi:acyl-CoA reductase-like NAD-dependent aldehyde dehydrogenase
MTTEDEEFNRMEREATLRRKAVSAALNDHVMHMRANLSEYERGVIDGRHMQMQSSVDKAVNAMAAQRQWQGLTNKERKDIWREAIGWGDPSHDDVGLMIAIEARLKELNT